MILARYRTLIVTSTICVGLQFILTVPMVAQDSLSEAPEKHALSGQVFVGYQGWFNCPEDGMGLGWTHWARNQHKAFGPGNVTVDLWPEMNEYAPDERFATEFRHADGQTAEVFSSANRSTVNRHFRWMKEYGIDGAFVQRFANGIGNRKLMRHKDQVLTNALDAAEQHGVRLAVMYDLSSMKVSTLDRVVKDWSALMTEEKITSSPAYVHLGKRPLVAIWGVGFADRHSGDQYSLDDCRRLILALRELGCSVMIGVPTGWREQDRDAVKDVELHSILTLADIISPWTPGRYRTPEEAIHHGRRTWALDKIWCDGRRLEFMPVVFPGFSWHNLKGQPLDQIPRLGGRFLWSQIVAAKKAGCGMIYVAMFDEVDEGTAIFKCTNDPPVGEGVAFLDYQGLSSDHYLRVVERGGQLLRGQVEAEMDWERFSQRVDARAAAVPESTASP